MGYATDLTDRQWEIIEPFFCREKRGKHFQKHSKRELVNAVLYLNKTGCLNLSSKPHTLNQAIGVAGECDGDALTYVVPEVVRAAVERRP